MQRCADFVHTSNAQAGDTPAQALLANGNCVVQINRTRIFHSIFDVQNYFGRHAANSRGDRSNGNCRQMADCAISGQNQNRSRFVRWRESEQMDTAACQSSGHAAASSHTLYS